MHWDPKQIGERKTGEGRTLRRHEKYETAGEPMEGQEESEQGAAARGPASGRQSIIDRPAEPGAASGFRRQNGERPTGRAAVTPRWGGGQSSSRRTVC